MQKNRPLRRIFQQLPTVSGNYYCCAFQVNASKKDHYVFCEVGVQITGWFIGKLSALQRGFNAINSGALK